MPHDIFLSYSRQDRERAERVVHALERAGWSVWWDPTIEPGETWDEVIEKALDEARCEVVLWSQESVRSRWVRTEAEEGQRRGILVPALLDDVKIPLAFRSMQAASLVDWSGALPHAGFERLARGVARKLSSAGAAVRPEATAVPTARETRPHPASVEEQSALAAPGDAVIVTRPAAKPAPAGGETRENPTDGLTYVWIPPGKFTMGCSPGDSECDEPEKPPHEVTITRGFWMNQTPVTEAAWLRFLKAKGESIGPKNSDSPVVNVSWEDAQKYCEWVGLRLPSEAEWEYAARAGTKGARYGELDDIAWHRGNSDGKPHPVRGKQPNAFVLYDMLGNVWEWVADWYGGYEKGATVDPTGPPDGKYRVLRGGSWYVDPGVVRVSFRVGYEPTLRLRDIGFRCAGELR
jgi:formylglycine-generating enzyme